MQTECRLSIYQESEMLPIFINSAENEKYILSFYVLFFQICRSGTKIDPPDLFIHSLVSGVSAVFIYVSITISLILY